MTPKDIVLTFLKALWGGRRDQGHSWVEKIILGSTQSVNIRGQPGPAGRAPDPGPAPHHEVNIAVLVPEILHQLLKAVQLLANLNKQTSQRKDLS